MSSVNDTCDSYMMLVNYSNNHELETKQSHSVSVG